jgi:hypothetical protein
MALYGAVPLAADPPLPFPVLAGLLGGNREGQNRAMPSAWGWGMTRHP